MLRSSVMIAVLIGCADGGDISITDEVPPVDTSTPTDVVDTDDSIVVIDPGPLELCINEFMPSNGASYSDQGEFPDWIELHNSSDELVNLDGWTMSDNRDEPAKHVFSGGLVMEPGDFLLVFPDSEGRLGPTHLDFGLDVDGEDVVLYAPDGRGSVVGYGSMETDIAAARVSDCCEGDECWDYVFQGTPGETNATVPEPEVESMSLVEKESTWAYNDGGSTPGADWTDAGFSDGSWDEGPGPLGYGDSHIATEVGFGGQSNNKHITTWMRTTFEAEEVADFIYARIGLLRDDGAVVYLNGTEVVRSNMPQGTIDADTTASSTIGSTTETTYEVFTIDPALIVDGENQLAAEVHQFDGTSSDLGFDLYLDVDYEVEVDTEGD
jgi:hypothetical protein